MKFLRWLKKVFLNKEKWIHFRDTLRYSLHCLGSPFDAFWDLNHEKRGSLSAATFIIILTLVTNIWKLRYTSFVFNPIQWEKENLLMDILTVLLPLVIYCVSNWSLTTLFDGKGTLSDIYMATGYALTQYVIIQLPLIVISNFVTEEEGSFYTYFGYFSLIWCGFLIIASVMMIHDFSFGKAIFMIIGTLVGMLVIVFIMILFFSLISDGISYFVSIYKEAVFRLY